MKKFEYKIESDISEQKLTEVLEIYGKTGGELVAIFRYMKFDTYGPFVYKLIFKLEIHEN
jgi:hypothetical protein